MCIPEYISPTGKFNRGVPTDVKKSTWAEITARVNEIGDCQREVIEVIKKWSDLKCDTKRKVAAMRAGTVPYKNINSRLSRDLSPIENIVHQILELDGKRGRLPTSDKSRYANIAEDDDAGDEEEEEEEVMLGMPPSSVRASPNGRLDASTRPPPPHSLLKSVPVSGALPVTMASSSLSHKEDHVTPAPVCCGPPYPQIQPLDSDEEQQEDTLPPSNPTEEEELLSSLGPSTNMANTTTANPTPSSSCSSVPIQQHLSSRDRMLHNASLSIQEQHTTNMLLETVSRSLELLSESVQQLAETQQEFVRDSLQLQRETVLILRDFASGALSLMHDKLNGRPTI
ncbi:nuclear apoptosis-inducing factor 1-like [Scleropages formosus]|uniref:Nuclear apoptosis-inducing factor 1-like n=1 Tax=Scleropages formosus TaxID=113540 RepID=A0A0P7WZL3_SCLFO|nr:nuclear apoptosis-inducing factor 1-like [Scleropages formosus]